MLFPPKPKKAIDLLQQMTKRAEDLSPEEQAKSFVAIGRIDGALKNRDSRIIFGRRGTGKTHILSYVSSNALEAGDIPCTIDLRTIGSNNSIYSDLTLDTSVRATRLIRDIVTAFYEKLLEQYTDSKTKSLGKDFELAIEKLSKCVRTITVVDAQETRRRTLNSDVAASDVGFSAVATPVTVAVDAHGRAETRVEDETEFETTVKGSPGLSVNMGEASKCLTEIAMRVEGRIWLLLDEWSSLPEEMQPYLADFIRRAVLPVQKITVQIAAIEYRSRFRLDLASGRVGLELGSDISADINLDDYFVYDTNGSHATEFFEQLLFNHLKTFSGNNGLEDKTSKAVLNSVFSQNRVFDELVRASEGVSRDFINILQKAAMRSNQNKLSMKEIRAAAKDWYESDKQRNLDQNAPAQSLLEWIRDRVIEGKKSRAFLLRADTTNGLIEFLFDERMLHIARRSYSAQDEPGVRYRVWKIDYGCYVDLLNTAKTPTGFLFEDCETTEAGDIVVPDDDYRAVRRAILELSEFEADAQVE